MTEEIREPSFIGSMYGEIEGIKNAKDLPWNFIGVTTLCPFSKAHRCESNPNRLPKFNYSPEISSFSSYETIILDRKLFRVPAWINGRIYQDRTLLVGQCPKCELIFFAEFQ